METSQKEHWNEIYAKKANTELGWYEAKSSPSIELIEGCSLPKESRIVDIGSGTSILISNLLALGYQNIHAVDISNVALQKARTLLGGEEESARVNWIVDDITNPSAVLELDNVALWHDRAVFHFLTDENDQKIYRSTIEKMLMPSGFLVMATFALSGAEKCSGLSVQRYSVKSLKDFFGDGFKLIESLEHIYEMPSGDLRPFTYVCFQKG
ncbi:MAG: class I SAM-dependent methyltransferase [Anaerolineae bacterium]|jgi:EEF1A lysine methyltransferase 2|nr:class I SAM-dependent methyltransferase [Anaerolineae bacterium]MBT7072298.1 class I SAM-dependent methyltransferase [Anaerolineae bacterium]MBT7326115.1 class I SAM-dependent methyltransferase [Anaerolineae bacterium]MBT7601780.1 class I SAM-dependent methyltransferase [Anaerolineae bacterium]